MGGRDRGFLFGKGGYLSRGYGGKGLRNVVLLDGVG